MLTCYRVLIIDQNSEIMICGNFLLEMLNWRWGPSSAYAEELAHQSFRSWFRILGGDTVCWPLSLETANHGITLLGGDLNLTSVGGRLVVLIRCWNGFLIQGSSRRNHCRDSSAVCRLWLWARGFGHLHGQFSASCFPSSLVHLGEDPQGPPYNLNF